MKRWKVALVAVLTIAMVMQSSNVQAIAEGIAEGLAGDRPVVTDTMPTDGTGTDEATGTDAVTGTEDVTTDEAEEDTTSTEATAPETNETATDTEATEEESTDAPAAPKEVVEDTTETEAPAEVPAEEADTTVTLNVEISGAKLTYKAEDGTEQNVTPETDPKSVDVPNTLDFKFTVTPDEGQQVSSVSYGETVLNAGESGEYAVAPEDLTDGEKIVVTTEAAPAEEASAEEAPAEETPVEPEAPAEEEPAEEGEAASEGAESQDAANGVAPMSARIAGDNSWSSEQEGVFNRYWSGTLSIGKHYYEGSSTPIGETTSVTLDTNGWGGASQTVNVSEIKLDGYDFRGAYYNDTQIQRLRINDNGALQYSSEAYGSSWRGVSNPDDIIFRYAKRGEYRVRWYVNGQLVETDWADAGDSPSYDGRNPIPQGARVTGSTKTICDSRVGQLARILRNGRPRETSRR